MEIIHSTYGPRHVGTELQEFRMIAGQIVKLTVRLNGGPASNSFANAVVLNHETLQATDLKVERLENEWIAEAHASTDTEGVVNSVAEELAEDMRVLLEEAGLSRSEEFQDV